MPPEELSRRVQFQNKGSVSINEMSPFTGVQVRLTRDIAGGQDVRELVDGEVAGEEIIATAADAASPDEIAILIQLRNEDVETAHAGQIEYPGARVEISGSVEL